ncbi:MAG: hypothetical protein HQK52_09080 [Oligoflexia bacterium]|nr:hypothetical protein [Oligoflexia bacterium]
MKLKSIVAMALLLVSSHNNTLLAESSLGSPAASGNAVSTDYDSLIKGAFPTFQAAELESKLTTIIARSATSLVGIDNIVIKDLEGGLKFFNLESSGERLNPNTFIGTNHDLFVNRSRGVVQMFDKRAVSKLLTDSELSLLMPKLKTQHLGMLKKVGVRDDEVLFLETAPMKVQTAKGGPSGFEKVLPAVVDEVATYVMRKSGDLLVEDSFVRLASNNERELRMLDLRWPALKTHTALKQMRVKSKDVLIREIATKTRLSAAGQKIGIRMAVVLRPVLAEGKVVYIPAMKVGVMPQDGETGEIFFVDLHSENLAYSEITPQGRDTDVSRLVGPIGR